MVSNPAAPLLTAVDPQDPKVIAEQRKARLKAIQSALAVLIPLGLASGLVGIILYFVAGDTIALAGGGGIFVLVASYLYPRVALWLFMFYMPFAGTVVYWVAGGNALFQLAKDAFYFPALIALVLASKKDKNPPLQPGIVRSASLAMLGFCLLCLLIVTLPRQLSGEGGGQPLLQGILGLKVFMGYVPLIFCMQVLLRRREDFLWLMRSHVFLAIVCCSLCLMQLMMLQSGRCAGTDHLSGNDLFVTNLDAKCLVGGALLYSPSQGVIRLPGTFVAPWQWGWFLIANAYITFATAFSDPALWGRLFGFAGMGFVTMGAIISGQRVAVALVPAAYVILLVLTGQFANIKRFVPIAIGSGIVGLVAWRLFPDLIQDRIDSFFGRWKASPADDMINHQFEFVWKAVHDLPLGMGLGTATNSCRIFGKTLLVETWFPKVMYEIGLIGLIVFLGYVTVLSLTTFMTYRSIKDPSLRSYAACLWVFVLFISYQTYFYPLDVDPVAIYYWICIGAIFRLPTLERQAQEAAGAAIAPPPPPEPLRVRPRSPAPAQPRPTPPERPTAPDPVSPIPAPSPPSGRFVRIRPPAPSPDSAPSSIPDSTPDVAPHSSPPSPPQTQPQPGRFRQLQR